MSHWQECFTWSVFPFLVSFLPMQRPRAETITPPEVPGSRKCLKKCHHDTVPIDDSDYRLLVLPSQFLGCT